MRWHIRKTIKGSQVHAASQKPTDGTQSTDAQKSQVNGTQDGFSELPNESGTSRNEPSKSAPKHNQTRKDGKVQDEYLANELDEWKEETVRLTKISKPVEVDEPRAPGWSDSHEMDGDMAPLVRDEDTVFAEEGRFAGSNLGGRM